ncbi:MAG: MBL fold metallo-hydrolase [Chitinophagales bacterium]|nr:MBL fold metallo-hydrolase [Chitinophagales bacterium]
MQIQFCGAAKTVTGSCHLLTLDNGKKILLDCGLYQGSSIEMRDFNSIWYFNPAEIDTIILSHAHIDHSGRIPKLVKDGFRGKIYCTSATRDLCAIMLLDSAFIQESEARQQSKREHKEIKPLYTEDDVKLTLKLFRTVEYDKHFYIENNVKVCFRDAGHILGSATVTLDIETENKNIRIGFTGDVGRYDRPILKDPTPMPICDYLISESTYGGVTHEESPVENDKLVKIIYETCIDNKGKLIIPAFSVGRTQEILHRLDQLEHDGILPNIPVYVDSPLAINATEIFRIHPECMDDDMHKYMLHDDNPFGWNNMKYVKNSERSKAINQSDEACIIIAASGMAEAGRVKHHIFHQIENANNTILIVGYCAENTLGAKLVKKPDEVKIFGILKKVNARIEVLGSMSAHADTPELLRFFESQNKSSMKQFFLVHGEEKRQVRLKNILEEQGYHDIVIPELGESFVIE